MLEQVFSGLFLAIRAVVESLRLLKMPWNDFTSDTVCGGICTPAVCLQASWLCWHVFPVICHLWLPLCDGCDRHAISVWWERLNEGVSDSISLITDSLGNTEIAERAVAFANIWFFLYHPVLWSAPRCCHLPREVSVPWLRPFLWSPQQYFKHFSDLSGFLQAEQLLTFILLLMVVFCPKVVVLT